MNRRLLLAPLACLFALHGALAIADDATSQNTANQRNTELRKDIAAKQAALAQRKGVQAPAKTGAAAILNAPIQTQDSPDTGSDQ